MATKVDPFVYPIPQELTKDKETRVFFEYFVRWAHDMWVRSGGGDDAVAEATIQEVYPWPTSEEGTGDVQNLYQNNIDTTLGKLRAVTVSEAYTAQVNDFVNAKSCATITFPQYPDDGDIIVIRNGDGSSIKLAGNGKSLNGSTTGTLSRQGTAIEFYYFIDSDEWFSK